MGKYPRLIDEGNEMNIEDVLKNVNMTMSELATLVAANLSAKETNELFHVKKMKSPVGSDIFADAKDASKTLKEQEAQYLIRMYLFFMKERVAIESRLNTMESMPNRALSHMLGEVKGREENIREILDTYSDNHPIASAMKKIKGVAAVISSGYVAYVDMNKATHFGQVLAYGGYSPTSKWIKGEKRNYNADFKTIFIHAGRSFQFSSGYPDSYFGTHYKWNKRIIEYKNSEGFYEEVAKEKLAKFKFDKEKSAYKAYSKGQLPKLHISALARLKTVALFVGIVHDYWSRHLGRHIVPYPFEHLGHTYFNMKTMEEVYRFEDEKREEIKRKGRKQTPFLEEYEAWKADYLKGQPIDEDLDYRQDLVHEIAESKIAPLPDYDDALVVQAAKEQDREDSDSKSE